MKVVFLKENKCENRIAITPEQVKTLSANFEVFIAKNYGTKFGYTNEHYTNSGAQMMAKHDIKNANLIVKLSALTFSELNSIKKANQILITNMFLANNTPYLKTLLKHSITSLGIEIFHKNNVYPWLIENAKIKALFAGNDLHDYLIKSANDTVLNPAIKNLENKITYVIVNYSYATDELIKLILKANNNVVLCETNKVYEQLVKNDTDIINAISRSTGKLTLLDSTFDTLVDETKKADVLINTTTLPGDKTHLKITHEMLKYMNNNTVFVDLGADQGIGCEDVKYYNTAKKPFTVIEGVVTISLNNIPSLYSAESTKYTSEFISSIINYFENDTIQTIKNNIFIKDAIQTFGHELTNETIGRALNLKVTKL